MLHVTRFFITEIIPRIVFFQPFRKFRVHDVLNILTAFITHNITKHDTFKQRNKYFKKCHLCFVTITFDTMVILRTGLIELNGV